MASNQTSNQRRTGNGAHNQPGHPAQTSGRSTTGYSREESREGGAMSSFAQQASQYYEQGEEQLRECMTGREGTAVFMALAGGFGVGLVIGAALGHSHQQERGWRERATAEGFGRRLMERIESMIPDALAEHFSR